MRRPSALDRMVRNFQHNWETNPQFRALWSGGLGLGIIVGLCACLAVAFTFANSVAAAISGSSTVSYYATPNGTVQSGSADSNIIFPTQTIPAWGAQYPPAGAPNPPSSTPAPTPSPMPTATLVPIATSGPGGGGGGTPAGTITLVSATLKVGQPGSVVLQTSVPNAQVNIFVYWPNGATSPQNLGLTNSAGIGTITTSAVPVGCSGQVRLWIKTDVSGTTTLYATCQP